MSTRRAPTKAPAPATVPAAELLALAARFDAQAALHRTHAQEVRTQYGDLHPGVFSAAGMAQVGEQAARDLRRLVDGWSPVAEARLWPELTNHTPEEDR